MSKKVTVRRNGKGDLYGVAVAPGPDGFYEQFTSAQMSSPAAHGLEVVESSDVGQNILRESAPRNDGWVKVRAARPMPPRPPAQAPTTAVSEQDRNIESFRRRAIEAFQLLGLSAEEAGIASHHDDGVLFDAWELIAGSSGAARHARGEREVDPRQVAFLRDVRSR